MKTSSIRWGTKIRSSVLFTIVLLFSGASDAPSCFAFWTEPAPPKERLHESAWAQWRGPLGTGEAVEADPPTEWSAKENVAWRVPVPGRGHGTPIIWGDYVFLTTANPIGPKLPPRWSGRPGAHNNLPVTSKHEFLVLAYDRKTGKLRWSKKVTEAIPVEGAHESASLASASPVTDGTHVFASFGSQGLYCLDFEGDIVWSKSLGTMHTKHGHGEGASPVLFRNLLLVNWDHEGQSFIVALNKSDGSELWKRERQEVTSWSTPLVVEPQGKYRK